MGAKNPGVKLEAVGTLVRVANITESCSGRSANVTIVIIHGSYASDRVIPDFIELIAMSAGFNCGRQRGFPVWRGHRRGHRVSQLDHEIDCLGIVARNIACVETKQVFTTLTVVE